MPCSSAAAITSASRTEPPGCTIARTPASAAWSTPSRKGKKASEPSAEPCVAWPRVRRLVDGEERRVDARHLAGADADRRAVAREHDRVRLHARHGAPREQQIATLLVRRLRASSRRSTRCRRSTPADAPARAGRRARACSRARRATSCAAPSSTRRFFLRPRISSAPSLNDGATTHSTNRLDTASAVASSTGTVNEITEPNAETGSHASAFWYASSASAPVASPHGVVCLMIAQHGCVAERLGREQRALEVEQVVERELLAALLLERGEARLRRARRRTPPPGRDSRRSAAPAPARAGG